MEVTRIVPERHHATFSDYAMITVIVEGAGFGRTTVTTATQSSRRIGIGPGWCGEFRPETHGPPQHHKAVCDFSMS